MSASPDFLYVENVVPFCFYQVTGIRGLIHSLKYYGQTGLAEALGKLFAYEWRAGGHLPEFDAIVPVPLHWRKRLKRGYNQSECIARGMAQVLNLPIRRWLRRVKYAKSQTRARFRMARWKNVRNSFVLAVRDVERIRGARILLVDDVITTGATVSGCVQALRAIPGVRITVASLAAPLGLCQRVLREEDYTRLFFNLRRGTGSTPDEEELPVD